MVHKIIGTYVSYIQEGLKKGCRFYGKGMAEPTNSSKECATAEHEVWKIFRLQ